MAVQFDAASTAALTSNGTSKTWSHTCSSTDRFLIVVVSLNTGFPTGMTATYAGVSMTAQYTPAGKKAVFTLIDPATGANNVVVSWTNNSQGAFTAVSYTGVNQTTPMGTAATANGSGTGPTVNVSATSLDLVVDGLMGFVTGSAVSATVGASQTQRANLADTNTDGSVAAQSSEPGATTVTMSWTLSVSSDWHIWGVALKPADPVGNPVAHTPYMWV